MDWQRRASSCTEPEKGTANTTVVKSLLWTLVNSRNDINLALSFIIQSKIIRTICKLKKMLTHLAAGLYITIWDYSISKCCYLMFSQKEIIAVNSRYTSCCYWPPSFQSHHILGWLFWLILITWSKHITGPSVSHKTRKLIRMFHWNFYQFSNQDSSLKLYKSLIRPHLEYVSAVYMEPSLAIG